MELRLFFGFVLMFIFERARAGEGQRERGDRGSKTGSTLTAEGHTRGLNSRTM